MNNKVVKDKRELPKNIKIGDVHYSYGVKMIVKDTEYQNEFGTFVLLERIVDEQNISNWEEHEGVKPHGENRYELMKSLCLYMRDDRLVPVGYLLKDHIKNEQIGVTFAEAWQLLYETGAINATASVSTLKNFTSKLIETIDELPSLDSRYWKIPLFNEQGELICPCSNNLKKEIDRNMKSIVSSRIDEKIRKNNRQKVDEYCEIQLTNAVEQIKRAKKITVLTGAGISTMSGIPDFQAFRGRDTWEKYLKRLTPFNILNHPNVFWNEFREILYEVLDDYLPVKTPKALSIALNQFKPNEGHQFFAWLEREHHKEIHIITQNVDGLHQSAGNRNVIEMHGNLEKCYCCKCNISYHFHKLITEIDSPVCECGGAIRPTAVFFGDQVHQFEQATEMVEDSDLIIIAGTALLISPFNFLPNYTVERNIPVIIMNEEDLAISSEKTTFVKGDISKSCEQIRGFLT